MTTSETLLFDTYALLEIFYGNKDYEKFLNCHVAITKLNLFELYYKLYNNYGEEIAKNEFDKYFGSAIDFDNEVIKDAAKLKSMFKKQDMSMADCIGYIKARKLGIKFLTGDKQFEFLPNVEFKK